MTDPKQNGSGNSKKMAFTVIGIIVIAILIFGGGTYLFAKLFSGQVKAADQYATTQLVASSYQSTVKADGVVQATDSVAVSPQVDGTVATVSVENGDKVSKGTTLFTLTNDSITQSAKTTQTTYTANKKTQAKAQKTYDSALDKLTAAKNALKKAKAAAAEEEETDPTYTFDATPYEDAVTQAQASVDTAKSVLETAKDNTATAKSAYDKAVEEKDDLTVKASQSGTIADLIVKKGMTTAAINAQGSALQIINLSTLVGIVKVPEASIGSVTVGQSASVTSTALPSTTLSATVSKVADTADTTDTTDTSNSTSSATDSSTTSSTDTTTYYDVTLTFATTTNVKVGMTISSQIELRDYGTVYYVPSTAVSTNGTSNYVEVVFGDSTVKKIQVIVVGTSTDNKSIIKSSDLSAGASIRTDFS